jgi:hypothetical protein
MMGLDFETIAQLVLFALAFYVMFVSFTRDPF